MYRYIYIYTYTSYATSSQLAEAGKDLIIQYQAKYEKDAAHLGPASYHNIILQKGRFGEQCRMSHHSSFVLKAQ